MPNKVKEKLKQGKPAVGFWISLPSPAIAEIMSGFNMDWLLIDTEHGSADYDIVEQLLRAMKGSEVVPLIRVAANDAALIKKALDRGAYGVLVPLVNTAEEAAAAVAACKYPPEGIRGIAGTRASRYGLVLGDYFRTWNDNVLVGIQIETRQALANVEAIAAVPGVDMLFCGPNDLSANLNMFMQFDRPEFQEAVQKILAAAKKHGKAAGYMAVNAQAALERIKDGFTFVTAGTDARLLSSGVQSAMEQIQAGLAKSGQ